jgi:hypothetical protein
MVPAGRHGERGAPGQARRVIAGPYAGSCTPVDGVGPASLQGSAGTRRYAWSFWISASVPPRRNPDWPPANVASVQLPLYENDSVPADEYVGRGGGGVVVGTTHVIVQLKVTVPD